MYEKQIELIIGTAFVIFGSSFIIYNIFATQAITTDIIIIQVSSIIVLFCGVFLLSKYRDRKSLESKNG